MDNIETFLTADQRRRILEKVKNRIIKKKGGSICFGLYHVVYEIDPFSAMDYLTYGDSFKKFQTVFKMDFKTAKEKFKATGSGKAYWWPIDIMTDRIKYVDYLITIQ